jgi:hypothetical protein
MREEICARVRHSARLVVAEGIVQTGGCGGHCTDWWLRRALCSNHVHIFSFSFGRLCLGGPVCASLQGGGGAFC